jgi:CheY-like chemotaxis protein
MEVADSSLRSGLRILVIEDEALIGMMLASMLEDLGCIVLGPATHVAEALAGAADMQIDAAIVDLNLNGVSALPVTEVLRQRGIPIILSSGYGDLPGGIASAALRKPYDAAAVEVALRAALDPPVRASV